MIAEQEALFGSKPSPKSGRNTLGTSAGATTSKRFSMGGAMLQTPHTDKITRHPNNTHRQNNNSKLQPSRTHHVSGGTAQVSCTYISIIQSCCLLLFLMCHNCIALFFPIQFDSVAFCEFATIKVHRNFILLIKWKYLILRLSITSWYSSPSFLTCVIFLMNCFVFLFL